MERKLASVQTIKEVLPIFHPLDGAETSIELVTFENIGWQCVAKRGARAMGFMRSLTWEGRFWDG